VNDQPNTWDDDKMLVSAISTTNPALGRYALRLVDVDAGQAHDLSVQAERRLGRQVSAIATRILRRAHARERELTRAGRDHPGPEQVAVCDMGDWISAE
jgi:hypothetical protein